MFIKIKPLSVNKCWQGKRFKTPDYKAYEEELLYTLPKFKIPDSELCICLEIGFSNKLSDLDNTAKPFIDILQKKYLFNDNRIYRIIMNKVIVKKGSEYIKFNIIKNK